PGQASARHADREDRDLLRDHRRIWLCGLPGASGLARAGGVARIRLRGTLWPAAGRQPASVATAQPAGCRRAQPVGQGRRARAGADAPVGRAARGLRDGDLVRIFNDRGACLAGLRVDDAARPGVIQLSTGAWYDPDPADPSYCRHGNPNVLTADVPSSTLSQGCAGQLTLVDVAAYRGIPPELTVTRPPDVSGRPRAPLPRER